MRIKSLLPLAYLIIGIVIASSHHYFKHLGTIKLVRRRSSRSSSGRSSYSASTCTFTEPLGATGIVAGNEPAPRAPSP